MAKPTFLMRTTIAGVAASAEALFPSGHGAPDWRDAEVVPRTLRYLEELPPQPRRLLMLLFVAIELLAPVLIGCASRFSRLPVDRRMEGIRRLRASPHRYRRTVGDGLKATLTMIYASHPRVLASLGEREGGFGRAEA